MTRTRPTPLIVLALIGAIGGYFLEAGLAASGRPILIVPLTLPLALIVIAVAVVVAAVPVRQAARGKARRRIDPFYATRVVVLSKACSVSGSLITGVSAGMVVYLLSRSVVPGVGSTLATVLSLASAIALLVCGLVAEHMCTVPPDEDDDKGTKSVHLDL